MTDIGEEYAKALFSLTAESGEDVSEGLETIRQAFADAPAYTALLDSPGIPADERADAVRKAFDGQVPDVLIRFIQVLVRHGNIRALPACIDAYQRMDMAKKQRSSARVVSAVPLDEAEKARLLEKLCARTGREVTAEWETDPALLGGVTIYIDGKVLDGSLRRRLHDMKEVIEG